MFKTLKEKLGVFQKKVDEEIKEEKKTGLGFREGKIDDILWALELILLESDVALPVIEKIKGQIKKELAAQKIGRDVKNLVEKAMKNAISEVLVSNTINFDNVIEKTGKPVKIMFVGVNGSGKTTVIAKIAYLLKEKGLSCVLAASDTFRAGAIEQIGVHAEKLGVKLIKHQSGSDPAAVAYDAVEHAGARKKDVVLIDTAGRMQTNVNLMDEMKKIKRIANPDLVVFVGDALTGNDAVNQASAFNDAVGIDAVVLTKIDADAKGGAALSVAYTIGKPIMFLGTGQEYKDLIPFDPEWMVNRLFG
ncbi:MAG: signal recognition particle-docking protein FtsY [Candidatus Thermoplasmatota archaeon]|nr:signal recognition particle-docking protein FtsY [Candidatus Thermoplasmatota archaeon]MBU4190145.1 signal recognition particle-docking protein FtsY [Candidatus Thermoplasmatota archaeon]MCG2827586.1 signal recognition particle-docking protein FtsY [Thermoplasmatales archaeon]